MGVNFSEISNTTNGPVFITTYNYTDTLYWKYRDARQVPNGGTPITVDSIAGGSAVKVAVIYNVFFDRKKFVCDLFSVNDGGSFTIEALTQEAGVKRHRGVGVTKLKKGMVISLDDALAEKVLSILRPALPVVVGLLGARLRM